MEHSRYQSRVKNFIEVAADIRIYVQLLHVRGELRPLAR
jgi:hypothetical protein